MTQEKAGISEAQNLVELVELSVESRELLDAVVAAASSDAFELAIAKMRERLLYLESSHLRDNVASLEHERALIDELERMREDDKHRLSVSGGIPMIQDWYPQPRTLREAAEYSLSHRLR